jgi:hypothetical protein
MSWYSVGMNDTRDCQGIAMNDKEYHGILEYIKEYQRRTTKEYQGRQTNSNECEGAARNSKESQAIAWSNEEFHVFS